MRTKSKRITKSISFVQSNSLLVDPSVDFTIHMYQRPGYSLTTFATRIIETYTSEPIPTGNTMYQILIHEIGHMVGLQDTYNPAGAGVGCTYGQPDSVMCSAKSNTLKPDDVAGVIAIFL